MSKERKECPRVFGLALAAICVGALATPPVAQAANCAFVSTTVLSERLAPEGLLFVRVYCPLGMADCDDPMIEATVSDGGLSVAGSWERVGRSRLDAWFVFRPDAPWEPGSYVLSSVPSSSPVEDFAFEVEASSSTFSLDESAVNVTLSMVLAPVGERICCPTDGEGDCAPSCGGADGARSVVEVQMHQPSAPSSVRWRIRDAELSDDAWVPDTRVQLTESREQYCVHIDAWDTYDDSHHAFERCIEANGVAGSNLGEVEASWSYMQLDRCSAPPIPGGWGLDTSGVARASDELPEVRQSLRTAFCEAKRAECELPSAHAPDGGFDDRLCGESPSACPCYHFHHYCPEYVAEQPGPDIDSGATPDTGPPISEDTDGGASCATSDSRSSAFVPLLVAALLCARRRRRA